ncbi:WD40 repeat-like protein [Mycena sanguinolenta]|uniref:WD40 repeat-like protein n=1 Tax=Mycena sanguinolenta TaxID=230812 RepID=A0A8H7DH02_9AGAR|nr:WD40 repeat-like protein [Mycena sanguinolenta]
MKLRLWGNREAGKPAVSPSTPTTGMESSVSEHGENKRKPGIKLWWSRKGKTKKETKAEKEAVKEMLDLHVGPAVETLPWVEWTKREGQDFCRQLEKWREGHPDHVNSTLERIRKTFLNFGQVAIKSDAVKDLLSAIGTPGFPASSLILGIVGVAVFAAKLKDNKEDVFDFVVQEVETIMNIAEMFSAAEDHGDEKLQDCWHDLKGHLDFVGSLFKWALEKLNSNIPLAIEDDLKTFKEKANNVIRRFNSRRQFRENIETLSKRRINFITEKLKTHLTKECTHDRQHNYGKDECHPGTLQNLLNVINEWTSTLAHDTSRCWWIMGLAAIGKSTVAMSIARCLQEGRPLSSLLENAELEGQDKIPCNSIFGAQFFINSRVPSTTNPDNIFPSMALQLCRLFEPARSYIFKTVTALDKTETLYRLTRFSKDQAQELFVKPLTAVANSTDFTMHTIFVIIDGIDELAMTSSTNTPGFITTFGSAICQLPPNVRILVLSRPEDSIIRPLGPFRNVIHILEFPMEQMFHDVDIFLQDQQSTLKEQFTDWPSPQQVDIIRETAHGYMAIAKLSLQWIITEARSSGGRRRGNNAFQVLKAVRNGNIYDFYRKVLLQAVPDDSDTLLQKACTVILSSLICMPKEPVCTIASLCHELDSSITSDDVEDFLSSIRSIATQSHDPIDRNTVPSPHKTLSDFLTSIHPPERFRVNVIQWHKDCATITFNVMNSPQLHFNMGNLRTSYLSRGCYMGFSNVVQNQNPFSPAGGVDALVSYACRTFHHHLPAGQVSSDEVSRMVRIIIQDKFLAWFEVIAIERLGSNVAEEFQNTLVSLLEGKDSELEDLLHSVAAFAKRCYFIWPHYNGGWWAIPQLYLSALPFFAPNLSIANHYFKKYFPSTLSLKPRARPIAHTNLHLASTSLPAEADLGTESNALTASSEGWYAEVDSCGHINVSNLHTQQVLEVVDLPSDACSVSALLWLSGSWLGAGFTDGTVRLWCRETRTWAACWCLVETAEDDDGSTDRETASENNDESMNRMDSKTHSNNAGEEKSGKTVMKLIIHPAIPSLLFSIFGDETISILEVNYTEPTVAKLTKKLLLFHSTGEPWRLDPPIVESQQGISHTLASWAEAKQDPIRTWPRYKASTVSPDNRHAVAVRHGALDVWDLEPENMKIIATLPGIQFPVRKDLSCMFFCSAQHFVTITGLFSIDIRVWDIGSILDGSSELEMDRWEFVPGNIGQRHNIDTGGWIVDTRSGEVLFWQPSWRRFWNPRNILAIGNQEYPEIDMTETAFGEKWVTLDEH